MVVVATIHLVLEQIVQLGFAGCSEVTVLKKKTDKMCVSPKYQLWAGIIKRKRPVCLSCCVHLVRADQPGAADSIWPSCLGKPIWRVNGGGSVLRLWHTRVPTAEDDLSRPLSKIKRYVSTVRTLSGSESLL